MSYIKGHYVNIFSTAEMLDISPEKRDTNLCPVEYLIQLAAFS